MATTSPKPPKVKELFLSAGQKIGQIPVKISYRIIELFSDGLYASPTKAIEELVSNSFDAGATNVHVILSSDPTADDALIAVIDDGESMNELGLQKHWIIGLSQKRSLSRLPKHRKQIGKFGIGKLATFVLAKKLTHICKRGDKYFAVTMDYAQIPQGKEEGIEDEEVVLPLRKLTQEEARQALPPALFGKSPGFEAIPLFGNKAPESWTIAIMSSLKDLSKEIQIGRLEWVLKTAMPICPDFKLYLDGNWLRPTKFDQKPAKSWILGKDIKPDSGDLESLNISLSPNKKAATVHKFGLQHPVIGRITGSVEVYESPLTEHIHRSHGFFIYVHERLINPDDSHFGISPNSLRHGTFSRFRMIVHIDELDKELRSSRENVRDTQLKINAQAFLLAIFNIARNYLQGLDESQTPGMKAAMTIKQTPGSLTFRPVIGLLESGLAGKSSPRLLNFPKNLSKKEAEDFVNDTKAKVEAEGGLSCRIEQKELLSQDGIAIFDVGNQVLYINTLHPFVAAYREDFERDDTLNLLCMAEVLTETYLYNVGLENSQVADAMLMRDELLRQLARRSMKRTANFVARDLLDSSTNQLQFERELVNTFDSLGFEAVHVGGKGKHDGIASAHLAADGGGKQRSYKVSLEAKSKESAGKKVQDLNIARIASHRDKTNCDHALVVGADFTLSSADTAPVSDARQNKIQTNKSITLIRAHDLAKLVRLRALLHIRLDRLQELFTTCVSPKESADWIDKLAKEKHVKPPYKQILEIIWKLQKEVSGEAVEFAAVTTALRLQKDIKLTKPELVNLCKAMEQMAREVVVRENTVELNQRPDKIIETAGDTLQQFPEEERKLAFKW